MRYEIIDLANKIREVMAINLPELEHRGKAGREYAVAHFTREVCLPKIISILEEAKHDA